MRLTKTSFFLLSSLVVLFAFTSGSVERFRSNFTPFFSSDTMPAQRIVDDMKNKMNADITSLKAPSKQISTDIKDIYKYRFEDLSQMLKRGHVLLDEEISAWLNGILDEIFKGNPSLDRNVRLLAHRTTVPNAFTYGEGTILFNLGLLARLENESQVASVLCHELAHHYSNHVENSIMKRLTLLHSKETAAQVKQATRSEYGVYTKLKSLFEQLDFGLKRHSRDHEFEADSLGLVYLMNTRFDAAEALREMAILDSVDKAKYQQQIDFKKHFYCNQFPFKSQWTTYTKSEMWHVSRSDRENADSLKTHPDCKKRIAAYERQLKAAKYSGNGKVKFLQSENHFREMTELVEFELVEGEFQRGNIDLALYHTLLMLDKYPDNIYLQAMVGKCFYKMHSYQKKHELGKVVRLPDPRFDDNFDRLLTFIHELRLSELANLGFCYLENKDAKFREDENFLHAYYLCSKMAENAESMSASKEKYKALFPKGRFIDDFK